MMYFIMMLTYFIGGVCSGDGSQFPEKCYAPVVCSKDHHSTTAWRQIFPQQCQDVQEPTGTPGRDDGKIAELEAKVRELSKKPAVGTLGNPAKSCASIKENRTNSQTGLFHLIDDEGNVFLTYCDMTTNGGGWTLVASVHENNIKGKCTAGDRWSSEQGNSADHPHGDGFWENWAIHGAAVSATSDDYKNPGYFMMNATDVMIWQVPNDTPLSSFESRSFLKYYTTSGFLSQYGGNLRSLFSKHFPIRSGEYNYSTDNGPAIPVTYDKGNNALIMDLNPPGGLNETDPGFIQFRVVNHEQSVLALCNGVRMKVGKANAEHYCVGITSHNIGHVGEETYCGDYASKDWPTQHAAEKLINSATLVFYR